MTECQARQLTRHERSEWVFKCREPETLKITAIWYRDCNVSQSLMWSRYLAVASKIQGTIKPYDMAAAAEHLGFPATLTNKTPYQYKSDG